MGLKIADLLKWRTSVTLMDDDGHEIHDDKDQPQVVYLRVIGDDDLAESHRLARQASREKRQALDDKGSLDWKEATQPIIQATAEELRILIKSARTSNIEAEAGASVERPELPQIEEFAVDPDAASLAEQEKLEAATEKVEEDYQKAIEDYIKVRTQIIVDELAPKQIKELKELALEEVAVLICLGEYYAELFDQKTWRGCYLDKACRERAFDSAEEFKSSATTIKQQLIDKYVELEANPDKIKN